jgi:hypothetical protein
MESNAREYEMTQPAMERRYALLEAAASLAPIFHAMAQEEARKGGYTHYLLTEPRTRAIKEAVAMLREIEELDAQNEI